MFGTPQGPHNSSEEWPGQEPEGDGAAAGLADGGEAGLVGVDAAGHCKVDVANLLKSP